MTDACERLPDRGKDPKEILKTMREFGRNDADYKSGRTWSLVYYLGEEHTNFLKKAHNLYFSENGLNPMAFKSLKRFESEVVRMTATMLSCDRNVVGTMTSGGTESCLLAVKTARDRARAKKRVTKPEMILPASAHVAFEKGAEYFHVKIVRAPTDKDGRADVRAVKKLINRNTALIVASAPSYPHGMVDPIEEIGAVAAKHGVPLHVDSCLGGFMLPFVEKLGYDIPPFDFRVPGVTSMSADIHKYGYAAKGASVILYRDMEFMKHQFFVTESWPGGIYASPALLGTRPGGAIAAAWAVMQALGESGYLDYARQSMDATHKLIDGIRAIPELEIIGKPAMSVFAYKSRSKDVNIFAVGDRMEARGWNMDRLQRPDALHAMVTPRHFEVADQFLAELREAVGEVKRDPSLATKGGAAMYGMISEIPLRGMIKKTVLKMMTDMYRSDGQSPNLDHPEEATDMATKAGLAFLGAKKKIEGFLSRR